jgi:uncharacterized membrane protein (UPF0127 family)
MKLMNKTTKQVLIPKLEMAASLWARTKGLIGRDHLPKDQALWILRCNSIHTFFMKFPIDLVFIDRDMIVRKTFKGVGPGRVVLPVWRAKSVIEFSDGFLTNNPISVGEQLHVDNSLS